MFVPAAFVAACFAATSTAALAAPPPPPDPPPPDPYRPTTTRAVERRKGLGLVKLISQVAIGTTVKTFRVLLGGSLTSTGLGFLAIDLQVGFFGALDRPSCVYRQESSEAKKTTFRLCRQERHLLMKVCPVFPASTVGSRPRSLGSGVFVNLGVLWAVGF